MKCDYCGGEGAVPLFFDGGAVGMVGVCAKPECIAAHKAYLHRTGFEHIGNADEWGDWCGRPQHVNYGETLQEPTIWDAFIDGFTLGPLRRWLRR